MPHCCAFNCNNKRETGSARSFHTFPISQPDVLKQWIVNLRLGDKWKSGKRILVCSDHFEEKCFDRTGQTVRLRKGAIPTIFKLPFLQPVVKRAPRKRCLQDGEEECVASTSHEETAVMQQKHIPSVSPQILKKKYCEMTSKVVGMKLGTEQPSVLRVKKNVVWLQEVVDDLKNKNLLSENAGFFLDAVVSETPPTFLPRTLEGSGKETISKEAYPESLQKFAVTLHFFSSKAYNYVRNNYNLSLPHPSTLRKWYSSMNTQPGFIQEAFEAIGRKLAEAKQEGKTLAFALMMEEMSIKETEEWDGNRVWGYMEIGVHIDGDLLIPAKSALVIMAVSVNDAWKVPIAYILVDYLSVEEKANFILEAVKRLYDINAHVVSFTCNNLAQLQALGANIKLPDPVPFFRHPLDETKRIYILLDVWHMLKMIRIAWMCCKTFKCEGGVIDLKYVTALRELLDKEGLGIGNNLPFNKQKLAMNLATQTISSSVADAIEWCGKNLKLPCFVGFEITVKFIRIIDHLVDMLSSRNPCAKGYKAPLQCSNKESWHPVLTSTISYLIHLTDGNGVPIYKSHVKTGVVGFVVSSLSVIGIFEELLGGLCSPINYILTYKFSLDHLEHFFITLQAVEDWTSYPTAKEFVTRFKELLVHHEVITSGNDSFVERTVMKGLNDSSDLHSGLIDMLDVALMRKYDRDLPDSPEEDDDVNGYDVPNTIPLSEYTENAISYIALHIVKMVRQRIKCPPCLHALEVVGNCPKQNSSISVAYLPGDILKICKATERHFHLMDYLPRNPHFVSTVITAMLEECGRINFFSELADHFSSTSPESENHLFRLIKTIGKCYLDFRIYGLSRRDKQKQLRKQFLLDLLQSVRTLNYS